MPEARHVKITNDHVAVDGHDLSRAVRRVELVADARHKPQVDVTLDLLIADIDVDTQARIHVPQATHDALVTLGWTPPADAITNRPAFMISAEHLASGVPDA